MKRYTVTVAGGSRSRRRQGAGAYMTLHTADCGVVKRAAEVRPGYLSGWVAGGRAVEQGGWADTPHRVGSMIAQSEGLLQTFEDGDFGNTVYAAAHAEKAAGGMRAYRVCGVCKPHEKLGVT